MIDFESLFDEIRNVLALACPDGQDTNALVHIAQSAVVRKASAISVEPESVESLWSWLEKTPTKIIARFFLKLPKSKKSDSVAEISELSQNVSLAFKKGAHGVQVFIPYAQLDSFINEVLPVRDGLFFNKDLHIGLDINDIHTADWPDVFARINKIKADALLLYLSRTKKGAPDFVGRVYGLLENWDNSFDGELHFMLGDNFEKIEQIWRLIQKMRPEIAKKLKFFVSN
jgi:hypothetical protein